VGPKEEIAEVFKAVGQPGVTYVRRDNGKFELILDSALREKGQICLITGPSKTGKTTLYREVLARRKELPLIVRCDRGLTASDVWKMALEAVDFERIETRSSSQATQYGAEVEAGGKLG
jgi:hypothetical protein